MFINDYLYAIAKNLERFPKNNIRSASFQFNKKNEPSFSFSFQLFQQDSRRRPYFCFQYLKLVKIRQSFDKALAITSIQIAKASASLISAFANINFLLCVFLIIQFLELASMNPYPNYPYDYSQPPHYGWYPPYYHQNPEYPPPYYNYGMYGPPMGYYPPPPPPGYQYPRPPPPRQQVIKLQEQSESLSSSDNSSQEKKQLKPIKRKKKEIKANKEDENIYAHPRIKVKHQVRYFDPSAAPTVTTVAYNLVDDIQKQVQRTRKIYDIPQEQVDELDFPQQYDNPFIMFKFRRIKKKFKKYIRPKGDQYFMSKAQDSDQEENSSQDDQSESQEPKSRKQPKKKAKQLPKQEIQPKAKQIQKKIKTIQPETKRGSSDSQYLLQ